MKFKIEYRKKMIPPDWIGMNYPASQKLHIPWHHKSKKVIEVYKKQSPKMLRSTEVHEETESYLIKYKHMPYKPANSKRSAHHWALQYEKLHKPFNIREVNKLLKKK